MVAGRSSNFLNALGRVRDHLKGAIHQPLTSLVKNGSQAYSTFNKYKGIFDEVASSPQFQAAVSGGKRIADISGDLLAGDRADTQQLARSVQDVIGGVKHGYETVQKRTKR